MLYKTYQLFLVSIIRVLWLRSSKMGQSLLQFQAYSVKNCINLHYVLYHNFYNNLNQETSEPISESREIGLQRIKKRENIYLISHPGPLPLFP